MKKLIIALVSAIGITFAVTPANAQYFGWGPYTTGWAGWLGGYYGPWGYGGYGPYIAQPYYTPGVVYETAPQIVQRKQIIIRNSPGARVIEQDIFDW